MEEIQQILNRLKTINTFKNKDEEYLISSYIDICNEMIAKGIEPSSELINTFKNILVTLKV